MQDSELTKGQRLKKLRKLKKITQLQLGDTLEMTDTAISHIENGKSGLTLENALKISQVYQVNLDWLLTGEGEIDKADASISVGSGFIGSGNMQQQGRHNQMGSNEAALKAEIESLKREVERQEKYIKRLERLLDKQEE